MSVYVCFAFTEGLEEQIYFALLLPMSGSSDRGLRMAGAAEIAVERVNANSSLLPGRKLGYRWRDSGCSAQQGLAAMGKLLQHGHTRGTAAKTGKIKKVSCSRANIPSVQLSDLDAQQLAKLQVIFPKAKTFRRSVFRVSLLVEKASPKRKRTDRWVGKWFNGQAGRWAG